MYRCGVWWSDNQGELDDDNFLVISLHTPLDLQLWIISSWCIDDENRSAKEKSLSIFIIREIIERKKNIGIFICFYKLFNNVIIYFVKMHFIC